MEERPDFTVGDAFSAPGFITFYCILATLLALTLVFYFLVRGKNRPLRNYCARFLTEEEQLAVAQAWKNRAENAVSANNVFEVANNARNGLAPINEDDGVFERELPQQMLFQIGYRHHAMGEILYYSWCILPILIQFLLLFLGLTILRANGGWFRACNAMFNLHLCDDEMLEEGNVRYCTSTKTNAGFVFNNVATVFGFFWLYFLLNLWILVSESYGQKVRELFYIPCSLSECTFVMIEEWKRDDKKASTIDEQNEKDARRLVWDQEKVLSDVNFTYYAYCLTLWKAGYSCLNLGDKTIQSCGVDSQTRGSASKDQIQRSKDQTQYQGNGNGKATENELGNDGKGALNSQMYGEGELRFITFQCTRYLYVEDANLFIEPINEFLMIETEARDVVKAYSGFGSQPSTPGSPTAFFNTIDNQHSSGRDECVRNQTEFNGNILAIGDVNNGTTQKSCQETRIRPTCEAGAARKLEVYGENVIAVECPGYFHFLKLEVMDFVTIFQLHTLWASTIFTNWPLAVVSCLLFSFFGMLNAAMTRKNQLEIQELATKHGEKNVTVFRQPTGQRNRYEQNGDQKFIRIETAASHLVPGDIIEVRPNMVVPCDCVVLTGSIVVNESNLTGEAMPIQKFPLDKNDENQLTIQKHGKRNILYAGTSVMQSLWTANSANNMVSSTSSNDSIKRNGDGSRSTNRNDDDGASDRNSAEKENLYRNHGCAVITSTGAQTTKGQLIRDILYQPECSFELFDKFQTAVMIHVAIGFLFGTALMFTNAGSWQSFKLTFVGNFFEGVCMITRMLSPFIRVGFKIAQSDAANRMKEGEYKIQSLAFSRIPMAGKVEVQCFDKTGTLTEEGLDLHAIQPVMVSETPGNKIDGGRLRDSPKLVVGSPARRRPIIGQRPGDEVVFRTSQTDIGGDTTGGDMTGRTISSTTAVELGHMLKCEMHRRIRPRIDVTNLLDVAVATCHTVTKLDDGSLAGNKVECELVRHFDLDFEIQHKENVLEYFERVHADERTIGEEEDEENNTKIKNPVLFRTVRQFEFDQKIQLQSVVVELPGAARSNSTKKFNSEENNDPWSTSSKYIFTKGSPEKVAACCMPHTLPVDFYSKTKNIARNGYYLIAVARKNLDELSDPQTSKPSGKSTQMDEESGSATSRSRVTELPSSELPRSELEKDLTFTGLIYFKNELKVCTNSAIEELCKAGIKNVMITGDNVWNGLYIAKKCGIIRTKEETLIVADMIKPEAKPETPSSLLPGRPRGIRLQYFL